MIKVFGVEQSTIMIGDKEVQKIMIGSDMVYQSKDPNFDVQMKLSDGSVWGRVFYQNIPNAATWANQTQARDYQSTDKWSKLCLLDDDKYKCINGKYEFYLCYSDVTGFNRWRQASSPTTQNISGYEAVQLSWTKEDWGGLAKAPGYTYLDCSPSTGNWWYAIGNYSAYQGGVPGPNGIVVKKEISLYVRLK